MSENVSSVHNGNNNNKLSARYIRGWVSKNVSSVRNGNGIRGRVESGRGWERGRTENSVRKTRGRVLASGRRTSRYGGFSSNGNNNKCSARNIRGWVSERYYVSSVRNFRSVRNGNGNRVRGRVKSGRARNFLVSKASRGRVFRSFASKASRGLYVLARCRLSRSAVAVRAKARSS